MLALRVTGLGKRYRIGRGSGSGGGWFARTARSLHRQEHDFWALRDVTFDVPRGEPLGIIGHNGAGKSTLLKLLSRITAPTEGEIRIRGRLVALIELGSGFHPELTGRENVYLSGAVLGMRRREVTAKLDSIVAFAGVPEFIDVPVKWYSSGMYVRLGFAIAAHLEMDILLVDEVLAVGDASFQTKCFARIAELKREGATIVLISHDLASVERLCSRAVLLDHGRAALVGPAREVVAAYQRVVEGTPLQAAVGREGREDAEILSIEAAGRDATPVASVPTGAPAVVRIRYAARRELRSPRFDLFFYGFEDGTLQSHCRGAEPDLVPAGEGTAEFELPALGLQPGVYSLGATLTEQGATRPCAWSYGRATLYVPNGPGLQGRFYMPSAFRHRPPRAAPCAEGGVMLEVDRRPVVSVVIPCYNQAQFLGEAVESALGQAGCRPEVIVVDDGSHPPLSPEAWARRGVRCLRQPNAGVAAARNAGLAASGADYIVFLDADDRLAPGGIEAGLQRLLARPDAACAIGLCRVIDHAGEPRPFQQQQPVDEDPFRALLQGNFVWMPAQVVYRRSVLRRFGGFDPEVPACADYDLYFRIARAALVVCHDAVVAEYRHHGSNMSGNGVLMLRSAVAVLERQWPHVRHRRDYRRAYAAGNRFWRAFYGDRVVEEIRAGVRGRSSVGRAAHAALTLLLYAPGVAALHLFRKLRVMVRRT